MGSKLDKTGSWTALFIGLPIGLLFSSIVLLISLFPPFDLGLAAIGGGLFWHPIIFAVLIPSAFITLIWLGGIRVNRYLNKGYSIIKTSFLFTLFINVWLFALMTPIFFVGELIIGTFSVFTLCIALGLILVVFIIATGVTTFTMGLLIATVTKQRIQKQKDIVSKSVTKSDLI